MYTPVGCLDVVDPIGKLSPCYFRTQSVFSIARLIGKFFDGDQCQVLHYPSVSASDIISVNKEHNHVI